ncbi:hypothetical protein MVI27_10280 [Chryseobacterium salipaludis]|uniref:hypothetical protein n=1 Tax=Chryseobacterium TaxID=59732 RepID=UPI001FF27149|nr:MULTISPECIES: hypothetical protein [Chryseobacterium]MCJ8498647.1 hypothetical protein [Chryseobacterium salipaludis]MCX3297703.1 hypothetical protein [Planobacterium sp. JC490]
MTEIFTTIFKTSEERIKNPFIGTFILSFIAINWKPIMILFFYNKLIEQKIDFISENYSNEWNLLYFPLIIALFYSLLLPYIMWLFDTTTFQALKGRNTNLYNSKIIDIEGKKRIAEQEIELEDIKANYKEKADLNKKISTLEALNSQKDLQIDNLKKSVVESNNQNQQYQNEIRDRELRIDELIEDSRNSKILKENYYSAYEKTPQELIKKFVEILPTMNLYFRSNSLSLETKREVENYLSLGLIDLHKSEKNQKFKLTDKGLYFLSRGI